MNIGKHLPRLLAVPLAAGIILCGAGALSASVLDLTSAGASGYVNGAFYQQIDPHSTGSGVIQSIVRVQSDTAEQGYNSDYRPVEFDEHTTGTFNHSLLLGSVPVVSLGGIDYRQFLLDINEKGSQPLISLDKFEIYLLPTGNMTGYASFGTSIYTLDPGQEDNWIKLDYSLNAGSGSGDMFAYIPNSLFTGSNQYVYLFSRFGDNEPSSDGFEEWAIQKAVNVPEPSSMLLVFGGVAGLAARLRRRKN